MSTTPARARARIRAVVVAVLVLAFVIPWTYAHIAYAWPWRRFQTGTRITCQGQYLVGAEPNQNATRLGTLTNDSLVRLDAWGEISMGAETAGFTLFTIEGNHVNDIAHVPELQLGESTTIAGVGTFTLKEAHSGTVWFTPNPGGAAFCFDPDPTFTVYDYAQQGH